MKFASVILDNNINKLLDYSIPEEMKNQILPGMRVEVMVRGKARKGYVFALKELSDIQNPLSIFRLLSEEVITPELFSLARWMSEYYCTSLSKVLKSMVPSSMRKELSHKEESFFSLAKTKNETLSFLSSLRRNNPKQSALLELLLSANKGLFLREIKERLAISPSSLKSLLKKKMICEQKIVTDSHFLFLEQDYFPTQNKTLSEEQKIALEKIVKTLNDKSFDCHLLYGITGSGKTEIYLQAIQHALSLDMGVLMLVPEISLTPQTIERFRARFQEKIAILHHKRSHRERKEDWQALIQKKIRIVIGARSAVFSPIADLGLIIVDEEHDASYKQSEEMPTYHARHIALMRAKKRPCCVLLGSATPSCESFHLAKEGKYQLSQLTQRAGNSFLPKIHIVSMNQENEKKNFLFSDLLLQKIKERFQLGEQTLLFLNRRGYHSFLICQRCSHVIQCLHCDVSLTFHKKENVLLCHSCGFRLPPPKACPSCGGSEHLQYKGVGTELVESSLKALFPFLRILRLDRDTAQKKESHEKLYKEFRSGKADLLIGTQMIVKGLHFPSVTLVGILNSDAALHIPDFRSSEAVFQLITQVAGRAGRSELPGEVILQTHMIDHPVIQLAAKQDFEAFFHREIEERKKFSYPPFTHMVKIASIGTSADKTKEFLESFRKKLISLLPQDAQIHPIVVSQKARIQDRFRFLFLIRAKNIKSVDLAISLLQKEMPAPSGLSLFIDVDPISTLF
jgi:primosomal protein N' (replication factor Y) (superfamily II helicase)